MKHEWELDEEGDIDTCAMAVGFHNGPRCRVCWMSYCEHCEPDCYDYEDCPGEEALRAEREQWRAERRERVANAIKDADNRLGRDGNAFLMSDSEWYGELADAAIAAMKEP